MRRSKKELDVEVEEELEEEGEAVGHAACGLALSRTWSTQDCPS